MAARTVQARPGGTARALSGRIAVITGGASGIGRARRGCSPLAARTSSSWTGTGRSARGRERARRHAWHPPRASRGGRRHERSTVDEMFRRTVLEYGGLDFLVASAGLATSASVMETSLDEWELSYAVLARGYFLAGRGAFRILIEQGRGGSILFVGSKNALVAGSNAAAYSSAKAAALHLGRCLAEEGGPKAFVSTPSTQMRSSKGRASGRPTGKQNEPARTASARTSSRPITRAGRSSASPSCRRTSPRRSHSSSGLNPTSPQATSSTSTAASPPPIPGSAKEAHHALQLPQLRRERNRPCICTDG